MPNTPPPYGGTSNYQDAFAFLQSQLATIETMVYEEQFPEVQYRELVPVSTSATEWAPNIIHYSRTRTGEPGPIAGRSTDFPKVSSTRRQHNVAIEMEGIAYDYTVEELNRARMLGENLPAEGARDARFMVERRLDRILKEGRNELQWDSFLFADSSGREGAPESIDASGSGAGRYWENKGALEILTDINNLLLGVYTASRTVEMADTLCVPPTIWTSLTSSFVPNTNETVLTTIMKNNVYTAKTGRQLMIREVRGLEACGADAGSNTFFGRILAYRKDPSVLRFHLPMPFRFLPVERNFMTFEVPGIYRVGGLEIRRPTVFRYMDKIGAPATRTFSPQ